MLEEDRDKPVTTVRDPFGEHESFGAHNNARLRAFLDGFGFDYEFISSTECYKSGRFDAVLLRDPGAVRRDPGGDAADAGRRSGAPPIRRSCRSARRPAGCCRCRPWSAMSDRGTIVFADEDGTLTEVPVTGGAVKLQWRPDWAGALDGARTSTTRCRART